MRLWAPRPAALRLQAEIEASGVPVLLFRTRGESAEIEDSRRHWDVLLPASSEAAVADRFGDRRAALEREA